MWVTGLILRFITHLNVTERNHVFKKCMLQQTLHGKFGRKSLLTRRQLAWKNIFLSNWQLTLLSESHDNLVPSFKTWNYALCHGRDLMNIEHTHTAQRSHCRNINFWWFRRDKFHIMTRSILYQITFQREIAHVWCNLIIQ